MAVIRVGTSGTSDQSPEKRLRLLCLHGHGGTPARLCSKLKDFFQSVLTTEDARTRTLGSSEARDVALAIECRCIGAPLPEASRREDGRQWWRYDENGMGDRPLDWAEMEVATTKLADELWKAQESEEPIDGVLGFSQGAEMVHTIALLKHQQDPRFQGLVSPSFVISLSGAVNPAHFESISGGGPPQDLSELYFGPGPREVALPCLFVGDFVSDGWYSSQRLSTTKDLYFDRTVVSHNQQHTVPTLSGTQSSNARRFLSRFMRQR